jgi:hypothetical protein
MTQYHGKNLYFAIYDNVGPTLRDLSTHLVSVDFPESVDSADSTTAGDGAHEFLAGLTNATISLSGIWDDGVAPAPDVVLAGLKGVSPAGLTGAGGWIFGPSGSTSGRVKYSGAGMVTAFGVSSGISDAVKFTATVQCSGAITRGTF